VVLIDVTGVSLVCHMCVTVTVTLPALLGVFLLVCSVMGSGGQVMPV
jgi:hypothetical protein